MYTTTSAPAAIELRGLGKTFGSTGGDRVRAVDGIGLTISPGRSLPSLGRTAPGRLRPWIWCSA